MLLFSSVMNVFDVVYFECILGSSVAKKSQYCITYLFYEFIYAMLNESLLAF
jgi:hypothetical protein